MKKKAQRRNLSLHKGGGSCAHFCMDRSELIDGGIEGWGNLSALTFLRGLDPLGVEDRLDLGLGEEAEQCRL